MEEASGFFVQLAMNYILTGKPITDICDHNSEVAKSLGKINVS